MATGSSINVRFWFGVILVLSVALVLLSLLFNGPSLSSVSDANRSYNSYYTISQAKNMSHVPGAAYVFLALGPQANQLNCPAAVESLVKFAGWDGDVYVVTDQPRCFSVQDILADSGIHPDRFHLKVADGHFSYGGIGFESEVALKKNRVRSKGMKTKLFDYVDADVDVVAFTDCDIIFGLEGCATDFIASGPDFSEPNVHIKFTRMDKSNGVFRGAHTGVFVAHREKSKTTLAAWYEEISKLIHKMDWMAYLAAYNRYSKELNSSSEIYHVERNYRAGQRHEEKRTAQRLLGVNSSDSESDRDEAIVKGSNTANSDSIAQTFAPDNPMEPSILRCTERACRDGKYEQFISLEGNSTTIYCMNHISKARCDRYGRDEVRSFVDRFRLKTYQKNKHSPDKDYNYQSHHYCVHSSISSLQYGWFPFGYLPFCPKLETVL